MALNRAARESQSQPTIAAQHFPHSSTFRYPSRQLCALRGALRAEPCGGGYCAKMDEGGGQFPSSHSRFKRWSLGEGTRMTQVSVHQAAAARSSIATIFLIVLGALLIGYSAPGQDRRLYRRAAALYRRGRICLWHHRLSLLALCHCQSCHAAEPPARDSDWLGDHSHSALSPRRWVRRAARQHARPLWRICLYRHGAAAREARAAAASDQISSLPRARARAACAHYRDDDQCGRSRRGRSHPVVAGQDRHHRGSSFRRRAVGHSRLQAPEPPLVRSADCRHGRRRQPQPRRHARHHFHADLRLNSRRKTA